MLYDYDYENTRRVSYDCDDEGIAVFVPVCEKCGRFVKADPTIKTNVDGLEPGPNATCSRCGRVEMPFDGFFGEEELG